MNFADVIRDIRFESLLSQEEFAKELGVSFSTVNRWESGKTKPKFRAMKSIESFCKKRRMDTSLCIEIWKEGK